MNQFYVLKETNTFSDAIECIGLASIIDKVFQQAMPNDKPEIMIEDKGICYQISVENDLSDDVISKCEYFDIIPFIANKKDDLKKLPFAFIDYQRQREIREQYYEALKRKEKEEDLIPVRKDFDIIRMFANMPGYRKSFYNCRAWGGYFPDLLHFIFAVYTKNLDEKDKTEKDVAKFIKEHKIQISGISALQDINPDKGKGVNQTKANGINLKGQKDHWLKQLIRFAGTWESFVSKYFNKDIKTYSLVPHKITYENLKGVYTGFKPYVRGSDSIKVDILMIQLLTKELIKHDVKYESHCDFFSPSDKVSGFQMAYYKNLGQRPAVTNIGFLGLPNFINFKDKDKGKIWIECLEEHQTIISRIDEGNSSNISMLLDYRQFISSSDFNLFFDFCYQYAKLLISSISKKQYFIKPFSLSSMEVFMQADSKFQQVLSNEGFQAIAAAIRNSTIVPIIHNNKKDVVFGLSHKLKIASRDKTTLATEISAFIQKYNENIMLKDYHQKIHRVYVTTEQMQSFFALLDSEKYSSQLIAGMLVAYGYAKEPSQEIKK